MALNRSDRCSTCLRKCYVTSGQNPIKMSCGHHTCFRCHQTQWLTSERNDSEEIKCIKCTLAILNDKSNDKHDLLKRHPELCVRSANVRAVIKGVREPKAQTDTADKIRSHTAKDTCGSDACPQHYKGVHHHRASSSPANVFLASPETEMNSKQSHESCKDKTRRNKDTEWSSEPNDKIYKLKDMSPPCGNVLKFTQLDPKQKYGHSEKTHKNITKAKFLFPEKSSKESSVSAINKAEGRVKQPSDSQPSRQTYTKTDTSVPTLPHTSTHDQYDNEGQNEVDSTVNSDNGSKSSGRSHHKHKSSHKKSKKKKKHKEKNRTKSGQDSSLQVTDIPDGNSKPKKKQLEMSLQPRHLNTTSAVCKVEVGETLSIHGNDEDFSSPVSGGSGIDTLSIAKDRQEEKWSFPVKKEDNLISANNEEVRLSVSEENMSVFWYAGSESGNTKEKKIVENNEEEILPTFGNNEGSLFSIAGNDDSESEGVVLSRSPMTSLDVCASSTRFSSPMSLDDYQLDNILSGNGTTELEVQDWGESDGDNTGQEIRNRKDSNKRDTNFMTSEESYHNMSDLLHCSEKENDLAENLGTHVKLEGIEKNGDRMSLDDSILDRSGILYYDPINDSDEDRLVIVSRPTSEVSLIGEDKIITKTKETLPAEVAEYQSYATNNSAPGNDSHLGKTEDDYDQLLQSYQTYLVEKSKATDACKDKNKTTQENDFVRGFQESYTTSLVCSQMANKALKAIEEAGEYQKGPYQLSAKMLTGVLNILVQQANLASTICSELLNSSERKQAEPLSNDTDVTHIFQDSTSETLANNEHSFGAKPSITKDITSKSRRDTVDPSSNACSSNTSAPSCSISEKDSAVKNNVRTESFFSEGAKVVGDSNMTISKCSGKSDKGKCSKELFVNHDNLDTKQQVVRKESQSQHSKETTLCVHQEKSVKTKDAGSSEKCNKNRHEQINDNPTHSFVHDKTLDIPCSEHEMERHNVTDVDKDSSTPGTSDLPIVGMQDNVNNVVTDNPLILSDMVLVGQKTPDLSSEGVQQASLGTQVTESEPETTGNKLDKQNIKIPDNQLQDVVEKDKPCTKGTGKSIIHPDKIKDRDRETRNSTNKPKPPKEKRNLFDSLFQVEESVVESPCKYRKLQFGKVPQSRTEDSTHVDTPARDHGKSSLGTINTTSLSNQRCRQVSGSTKKSKESHQVAVFNKRAETVSVVSSSSTPTTERKLKTTASVKSSSKRSSSVPSAQHYKDRKDGSKSRSRYHSSCGISEKDSSITHRRSGSHHRNNGSHRNQTRSSDEKAVTGQKVQRSESVVVHGNKRDICIQTEAQVVNQTPSKSKEKRQVKKGDTMSQLHKATEDVHCYVKESITEEKTKKSIKMTNSKDENSVIEDQSISRNNDTEGHDVNGHFIDSQCTVEMQHRRHCPDKLPTGFLHEYLRLDSESTNSMIGKPCDADAPSPIKSKIENCSEDLLVPVTCYSNHRTTSVLDVEEDAYLLTQQDEMYKQRSLARDEEIFRCLSFSDSDDDVPLAQIVESLRASQGKSSSTVDGVNEWEEDQLPKLSVPNTSKYCKQHSHRRSRCDRPDLKTYLEIRNALPDTPTDQCSETHEITWRNSLMPPPLEAVRRSKSREKSSQSTSTDRQASSATGTIPPGSEDVLGNQSSESAQESDPEHTNNCDGEGVNADSGERGGSSRKKKRHRRKKSDKPVVSSSSEECIPKGRKRGFQWRQECLRILDRVYNHEFSDPFRHEVKSKDTPDYYKIVKRGMCFDIIGYKLRCNIYEELRDFFLDVRLVFDNCRLYHKPESPIYQAGLVVKCFFRKVAKEILMPRTTARSRHPS